MRYLMIVKATPQSERGEFPPDAERMFAEMAEFNNQMIAAGVMLDGAGLKPSSAGKRIRFEGRGKTVVTDGQYRIKAGSRVELLGDRDTAPTQKSTGGL